MKKKFIVRLSKEERQDLTNLVRKGKVAVYRRTHAQILLLADEGEHGPRYRNKEVAERVGVNHRTVSKLRQRCVKRGLDAALEREPRKRDRSRVLDGDAEAQVIALMCSESPVGQARWTLKLLGHRLVELEVVESVSHETIRQALKKHL